MMNVHANCIQIIKNETHFSIRFSLYHEINSNTYKVHFNSLLNRATVYRQSFCSTLTCTEQSIHEFLSESQRESRVL